MGLKRLGSDLGPMAPFEVRLVILMVKLLVIFPDANVKFSSSILRKVVHHGDAANMFKRSLIWRQRCQVLSSSLLSNKHDSQKCQRKHVMSPVSFYHYIIIIFGEQSC